MSLSVFTAGRETPDADAVVLSGGHVWTWEYVAKRTAAVRQWMYRRWSRAGRIHRVAFVAYDTPAVWLATYALWESGWTAVPMHVRWTEAERESYLRRLGVESLLKEEDFIELERLAPSWAIPEPAPHAGESIAALVATSGSTGQPKAAALSRRAFEHSANASAARLGWRDDDRWLLSLPVAHVGGLSILARCLEARRAVVQAPSGAFDPRRTLEVAAEEGVTLLSLVPTMLRRILDDAPTPPRSLRAVLLGGAAAPASWVEEAVATGWPLWLTYGLTEACSQVATGPANAGPGLPLLDGVEARVDDGVLEIRSQALFSGYQPGGPDWLPEQWFRTQDLASLERRDERTWLTVLGRADDVIVTGGENVSPAEVEAALLAHPRVRSACVVGLPDARWGEIVAAIVVADDATKAEVEAFLRQRLAGFRLPRRWRFVDELPTSAVGKVDRDAVRRLFP